MTRWLTADFTFRRRSSWVSRLQEAPSVTVLESRRDCAPQFIGSEELKRCEELDAYGEYPDEFIAHLVELLMVQEKDGGNAFMFEESLRP